MKSPEFIVQKVQVENVEGESDEEYYKRFAHFKCTIYDTIDGKTVKLEISHELHDYYCFIYVAAFLIRHGINFAAQQCE